MNIFSNNHCLLPTSFFMQYMNGFQSLHKETLYQQRSAHLSSYTTLLTLNLYLVRLEIQNGTITEYKFLVAPNVMSMPHLLHIMWYSSHLPYHQVCQSCNLTLKQDTDFIHSSKQWHWNNGHKLKTCLGFSGPKFSCIMVYQLQNHLTTFQTKNESTNFLCCDPCFS